MLCACVFNCSNSHMYVIIGTEVSGVNPAAVLHGLSLAILCIFMVEVSVFVYVCVCHCACVCVCVCVLICDVYVYCVWGTHSIYVA